MFDMHFFHLESQLKLDMYYAVEHKFSVCFFFIFSELVEDFMSSNLTVNAAGFQKHYTDQLQGDSVYFWIPCKLLSVFSQLTKILIEQREITANATGFQKHYTDQTQGDSVCFWLPCKLLSVKIKEKKLNKSSSSVLIFLLDLNFLFI